MRPTFSLSLFLLPVSALQIPTIIADFYAPLDALLNETSIPQDRSLELLKRDGNCPSNHNSCSTLAAKDAGACCTAGTFCTLDSSKNIACCPSGAKCTGTVTVGATGTAAGGGAVFGATTTTAGAAATTTSGATITGTASYVQNSYFPFPYIPTDYVNSAACNTAFSACQSNYAACTNDLMGNSFGVTVVAPNGAGVTVAPTLANVGVASATSICSSLSSVGCYNIQSGNCAQFGSGTASGGTFVVADSTGGGARPTMGCMAAAGVMAGLGLAGRIL